jgi:PAS domain S-box-containing protein
VVARIDTSGYRFSGGTLAVDRQEFERVLQPFLDRAWTGEALSGEGILDTSAGALLAQIVVLPELGAGGEVAALLAVAIDLTGRNRLVESARAGAITLPAVLECSTQAIVGADPSGIIRFCNPATESIFGYQRDELIGQTVEVLLPRRLREKHKDHRAGFDGRARCTPVGQDRDLHGQRKDGTEFPVEVHLSSVDSREGITLAFVSDVSARRKAESAHRETARLLQQALRATHSVAWEWEPGQACGRALAEAIVDCVPWGGEREAAVDSEDWRRLTEAAETVLSGQTSSINVDFRARIAGGEARWYACKGRVVRAPAEHTPVALAGVVTDIDDQRLAESERDLFFTMSPDLLCITDASGRFVDVNPAFTRLLGWSVEELTAEPFIDRFVHPEDRAAASAAFAELRRTGRPGTIENRYLCKDGGYRRLQWYPAAVVSANRIYGVARDVTDQRLAEVESRRLGQLVQASDAFVALADREGTLLFVNRAGLMLAGYDTLPPAAIAELIPELEGQPLSWHGEAELRCKAAGERIPVEVTRFPVSSGEEEMSGIIARDIRIRKGNEARLHSLAAQLLTAQEDERSRIARELHDDFTQKLAVLGIEVGALRKYAAGPEGEALVTRLREQLASLSEDARLLSHQLHPAALEYAGLAGALQSHCRDVARQHGLRIHCAMRHVPVEVPRELSVAFYRIAQEALRNVVRHAAAKSATVTLAGSAGRLRLTVSDDGSGFEGTPSGQGIGFDSMRERARLIGASLHIDSVPGEGTSVAVEAPCPNAGEKEGSVQ